MRRSEFYTLVTEEFGEGYGQVILADQVLTELEDRTAQRALAEGINPKRVWRAICVQMQVDPSRWAGVPLSQSPRR